MSNLDIAVHSHGSITGIEPRTAAGRDWCSEHLDAPAWACAGRLVWCDHRPARDIVDGAKADGLQVGPA
jgi:hypothetical protein